jgi:hypothetical protein
MLCVSHETHDDRKEKGEAILRVHYRPTYLYLFWFFLGGSIGQHVRQTVREKRRKIHFFFTPDFKPVRNETNIGMWQKSGVKEDVSCQKCHWNQVYRVV